MGPLSGKNGHSPFNAGNHGGNSGKFSRMPGRFNNSPMRTGNRPMFSNGPRHFGGGMGGGRFSQRFSSARRACRSPAAGSVAAGRLAADVRSAASGGGTDREHQTMQNQAERTLCPISV